MNGAGAASERRGAPGGGSVDYASWLSLAATPTFAAMAFLTGVAGDPMARMCGPGRWPPLNDMALMYLLMSAFHAPPWLRLLLRPAGRRHRG
jgi:hypothetical protein